MPRVAILVDFENLVLGAEAMPPAKCNPLPTKALERLCRQHGEATTRRAYADWVRPQFGRHQETLCMNGFDLIQVKRFGSSQENAADIRLAVDAMETVMLHPDVEVFILVAGDGDFTPLVQKLREFGKTVIGVGTEANASRRLISVCTDYMDWVDLVAEVNPNVRAALSARRGLAEVRPLLVAALARAPQMPVDAGWIKEEMVRLDAGFDVRNHGCETFVDFCKAMDDVVSTVSGSGCLLLEPAPSVDLASVKLPEHLQPDALRATARVLSRLRQRRVTIASEPAARTRLLSLVYESWRAGELGVAGDVLSVLQDRAPELSGAMRQTMMIALTDARTGSLPLIETSERCRWRDRRVRAWTGIEMQEWLNAADISCATFVARRAASEVSDVRRFVLEAFFAGFEAEGEDVAATVVQQVELHPKAAPRPSLGLVS